MSERRRLVFGDADQVAAEVSRLRKGYRKMGNWSLPQICQHLTKAIGYSMNPAPDRKVESGFMQWLQVKAILAFGQIPAGVEAPQRIVPPEETEESAVDDFLSMLQKLKDFRGEFAPHPMLGRMKHGDFVKLHLIHCAHHLGFLTPAPAAGQAPAVG